MGPVLHTIMHQQAQRRRAKAKEKKVINLNGQPKTEDEVFKEQMAFVMMAQAADKEAKAKAHAAGEIAHAPTKPALLRSPAAQDTFEERPKQEQVPEPEHKDRKPYKQPGPGFLLKLAHWLNLK